MNRLIFVILAVVVGMLFVDIASTSLDDATTTEVTQVTSITSGGTGSLGSGTLALNVQNYFTDRTNMTITGSVDGALNNASSTIDADRNGITFLAGSMTGTTTQNITVVHRTEDLTDDAVGIIQIVPFLFVMGIITSTVFGSFIGGKAGLSGSFKITEFVTVLVGLILIGTVTSFVASTNDTYAVRPEYTGVTAVLPLVTIGYVIGLLAGLVGFGAGKARGAFG